MYRLPIEVSYHDVRDVLCAQIGSTLPPRVTPHGDWAITAEDKKPVAHWARVWNYKHCLKIISQTDVIFQCCDLRVSEREDTGPR